MQITAREMKQSPVVSTELKREKLEFGEATAPRTCRAGHQRNELCRKGLLKSTWSPFESLAEFQSMLHKVNTQG